MLYMNKKSDLTKVFIYILVFVIISLPILSDIMYTAEGHDTLFHTQRILSIKHGLESGQFPVRIYTDVYNGYGYGSPLFYPELFLYIPAILCLLGIPVVFSYNIFLLLINAAAMAIAKLAFSKITESETIGMLAMVLYTGCTYRLFDIYVRGSLGEILALVFCPLVLYGLQAIQKREYHKWWILVIAFSGLIQSHVLTFVLMTMIAAGYIFFHLKSFLKKRALWTLFGAGSITILLNLWFLLPFLQASGLDVIVMEYNGGFENTGASFIQLFDVLLFSVNGRETWSFNLAESLTKTPGITLIAGAIFTIFFLMAEEDALQSEKRKAFSYLLAGLYFLWMTTNLFPWKLIEHISFLKYFFSKFQFMWRFNIGAVLFLSAASAYGIYHFFIREAVNKKKSVFLAVLIILGSSVLFYNQYMKWAVFMDSDTAIQKSHMDDLYAVRGFNYNNREDITSNLTHVTYTEVIKREGAVSFYFHADDSVLSELAADDKAFLEVPITHYPGYSVQINGKNAEYGCGTGGVIRVWLPEGCTEGFAAVCLKEPVPWKLANIISLLSSILFLTYIIYKNRNKFWRTASEGGAKYHGSYFRPEGEAE